MKTTVRIATILSMIAGCGSSDPRSGAPPLGDTDSGICNASCGAAGAGGGRVDGGATSDGPLAEGSISPDLGAVTVVDVPAAPCTLTTAIPVTVRETDPSFITFNQAGVVGSRRFALDGNTLALLTFDADGAAPSSLARGTLFAAATASDRLAALWSDGQTLNLQFYDASGMALAARPQLATGASGAHALAVGPDSLLALWKAIGELVGRIVAQDGQLAGAFTLGADSWCGGDCAVRAVWNGRGFAIVWSRVLQDDRTKTSWAHVGTDGNVGFTKPVLQASGYHRLVDVSLVGSRYALLMGEGFPTRDTVLVFLDDYGNLLPPARRLLGSGAPWAIASRGDALAVTASLRDGRAALRPLTASGESLADWACLDDSEPNSGFSASAALYLDTVGYGLVVRMADGSAAYLRTNEKGMAR